MIARLLIAAASTALLAGAASAQTTNAPTPDASAPPPAVSSAPAPDASAPPADTTGYNARASAAPDAGPVLPAPSSALGDTTTLKAGDTGVVSNGPVPDTAENRAKYGKPDSHAGKKTAPAGN